MMINTIQFCGKAFATSGGVDFDSRSAPTRR